MKKVAKENLIKYLNQKFLFHQRKMFGMYGQVNFRVANIADNLFTIQVYNPAKIVKDREKIVKGILKSIESDLKVISPNRKIKIIFVSRSKYYKST